ncbi:MAG: hypothetical protein NC177_08845 [Ruminococcus flavefaciens]|nr:hypothetical protein [Ruminococcus flavefaciens]
MDYHIDIIISEKDFSVAGIKEMKFFWGGEKYSHTPRKFETEDSLILKEFETSSYSTENIDTPVMLTTNAIYDLRNTAYWCPDKLESHILMKFLKRVSGLDSFSIYLQGDDELIDYTIEYTGNPDISEIIYKAFRYNKSIMIYK